MEQVIIPEDHSVENVPIPDAFDPFYSNFRMTDSLPHWLQLQQQIREHLNRLMAGLDSASLVLTESEINVINEKIAVYNENVPNIHLRKALVKPDHVEEAFESWQ